MYPAADTEDLDAQIAFEEALIKAIRLLTTNRDPRQKILAARRQIDEERILLDLRAERERRDAPQLLMAAEAAPAR